MNRVQPPYGELWKVARVDTSAEPVTPEQRAEAVAWLESLGIPYRKCRPTLVITENAEDGRLLLHLAQMQTDPQGAKVVNFAENVLHTVPVVVRIDKDSYPAWLVQASHVQDQATKEED